MRRLLHVLNPAVPRAALAPLAGAVWATVGVMLLVRAVIWLSDADVRPMAVAAAIGLAMAAVLLPRAFVPLVDKNLARLMARPPRACVFSLFAWRSWMMIALMSVGGVTLRHLPVPRLVLAAPYLGMGICLLGGSIRYFRRSRTGPATPA